MKINNKERYPGVSWEEQPSTIGRVGGEALWLLGYEEGTDAAIVGRSGDPTPKEIYPFYLYELMGHSQDPIEITGKLKGMNNEP